MFIDVWSVDCLSIGLHSVVLFLRYRRCYRRIMWFDTHDWYLICDHLMTGNGNRWNILYCNRLSYRVFFFAWLIDIDISLAVRIWVWVSNMWSYLKDVSCDMFSCLVDVSYSCNIDMILYGRILDMWISSIEAAVAIATTMVLLLLFVFLGIFLDTLCGMVRGESRGVTHETSKSHGSWLNNVGTGRYMSHGLFRTWLIEASSMVMIVVDMFATRQRRRSFGIRIDDPHTHRRWRSLGIWNDVPTYPSTTKILRDEDRRSTYPY